MTKPVVFLAVCVMSLGSCVSGDDSTTDAGIDAAPDVFDAGVSDVAPIVDASLDVEAEAHIWSPADLSNLVLWLDPADINLADQAKIALWSDRSPFKNDALGDQVGGDNRPTLVKNGIDSKPSVHFAHPSYLTIIDSTSLQWGAGDYTIILVARYSNPNDGATWALFYRKADASAIGVHFFGNSLVNGASTKIGGFNLSTQAVESSGSGYNNNAAHVFSFTRTGAVIQIIIDGSIVGSVTESPITDANTVGWNVTMGGVNGSTSLSLLGDIADVVAIKGTLSGGDRTTLTTYLQSKYGL